MKRTFRVISLFAVALAITALSLSSCAGSKKSRGGGDDTTYAPVELEDERA